MTTTLVRPPVITEVAVRRVERLSPTFVRVWLGGEALAELGVDGPWLDQRVKLVFPGPSGRPPQVGGPDWYADWSALPAGERGSMRTYTVRAVEGAGVDTEVVIDLVLHLGPDASGPGGLWAAHAQVGDRLLFIGPRRGHAFGGIEFVPGSASRLLLVGDETAVPAVSGILRDLPLDAAGTAYLEVPEPGDLLDLTAPPGVRVTWLPRHDAAHGSRALVAVRTLFGLPVQGSTVPRQVDADLWETPTYSSSGEQIGADTPGDAGLYAWVAGEAGMVAALRRTLVREAGLARSQVAFMGYWRHGVAMKG